MTYTRARRTTIANSVPFEPLTGLYARAGRRMRVADGCDAWPGCCKPNISVACMIEPFDETGDAHTQKCVRNFSSSDTLTRTIFKRNPRAIDDHDVLDAAPAQSAPLPPCRFPIVDSVYASAQRAVRTHTARRSRSYLERFRSMSFARYGVNPESAAGDDAAGARRNSELSSRRSLGRRS
jgi:hypothetical protein